MKTIVAVILAAGASRRFGDDDKLLADVAGKPVLARVLDALRQGGVADRCVVAAPGADAVAALCADARGAIRLVVNDDAARGVGGSIARGARALPDDAAALIMPGDMPFIAPASIRRLAQTARKAEPRAIIAPRFQGVRGHPVIFGPAYLPALRTLSGDVGARGVINAHGAHLISVGVDDAGVVRDVDRKRDLDDSAAH